MAREWDHRIVADDLMRRIDAGEYPRGSRLPSYEYLMKQWRKHRQTIATAMGTLKNRGYVKTKKGVGIIVRDRRKITVQLSAARVAPVGGDRGPWETACAEQGIRGEMKVLDVEEVAATADLAEKLGVAGGDRLVHRERRGLAEDEVVVIQHLWSPYALFEGTPIVGREKIMGGMYGAFVAAGHQPASARYRINTRTATDDERAEFDAGDSVPVLTVDWVTRNRDGQVIELLRVIYVGDRVELTDEVSLIGDEET